MPTVKLDQNIVNVTLGSTGKNIKLGDSTSTWSNNQYTDQTATFNYIQLTLSDDTPLSLNLVGSNNITFNSKEVVNVIGPGAQPAYIVTFTSASGKTLANFSATND